MLSGAVLVQNSSITVCKSNYNYSHLEMLSEAVLVQNSSITVCKSKLELHSSRDAVRGCVSAEQ